jgi:hypothetical protein
LIGNDIAALESDRAVGRVQPPFPDLVTEEAASHALLPVAAENRRSGPQK